MNGSLYHALPWAYAKVFGKPARDFIQILQLAHAAKCARTRTYTDNPLARISPHVGLYGSPGTNKSTMLKTFAEDAAGAINVKKVGPSGLATDNPVYLTVTGGTSKERIRGGFTTRGGIIPPYACDVDYIIVPELFGHLGHNPASRKDAIEYYNSALEEGEADIDLNKALETPLEDRKKMAALIPDDANYTYDPIRATIFYQCRFSMFFATKDDEKEFKALKASGFLSRFLLAETEMSEEEARQHDKDRYSELIETIRPSLDWARERNLHLWRIPIKNVNYPPDGIIRPLCSFIVDRYGEVCDEYGEKYNRQKDDRLWTNVSTLLTGAALCRLASAPDFLERKSIESIEYTQADVEIVRAIYERNVGLLEYRLSRESDGTSKTEQLQSLKRTLRDYLWMVRERDHVEVPSEVNHRELRKYVEDTEKVKRTTAFARTKAMAAVGLIAPGSRSESRKIPNHILSEFGLTESPKHPDEVDFDDGPAPTPEEERRRIEMEEARLAAME